MTVKYKTVITKAGAEKLAAATVPNGKKVNFTAMAVGDGGGQLPTPNASQTKLINEVWRHALNKISQDKKNKNYVVAELLIPPEIGGFWMREMGLYDDTGTLIAVGNMAESYKPALAEGSGRAQTMRMVIMVSDIASVELTIDTSTVMATQDYVDDKLAEHEQSRRHPDASLTAKGFTQLSSAIDSVSEVVAATPKAVKVAYDLAKGKYTAQDASTAQKGIVQLSSAIDSVSEVLAATPKAVKATYDLAKGKYTAQDASTAQKGIVQLSSAIDNVSETLAATPKAVKTAYDLAKGKYTALDATTTQKGIVQLSSAADSASEALAATPKAVKTANDNAVAANRNASERVSKFGDSMSGTLNLDGVKQGVYLQSGLSNGMRGEKNYLRKMRGGEGDTIWHETVQQGNWRLATGSTDGQEEINLSTANGLRARLEITSLNANGMRIAYGDYGTFWRNDGANLYLMLTNKGDKFGGYNSLRPLWVSLETGALNSASPLSVNNTIYAGKEITAGYSGNYAWVEQYNTKAPFFNLYSTAGTSEYHPVLKQQATIQGVNSWAFSMGSLVSSSVLSWHLHMKGSGGQDVNYKWDTSGNFIAPGQIIPGSFTNFDSRYYTKGQSDAGYMAKTSAYTKAESDARYNLKNTASKAASGWEKDNSTGIMKQWGVATRSADSTRIAFPTAFPNACLSVQLTLLYTNGFHDQNIYVQNPDKSGFTYVAGSGEVKVYFEARGY
ncbi:tail fiber protein [Enterobacter ludwigii]|uniref:tail fiber protein n=1 Tax=Enterobacter ludwigii TaxID=299767 RepID=UPI0020755EDC|nr:tail fiber protein [Enterobacter ludwigii]MCM7367327.1 tail fiber protein [Enterobacter ludwigii]MDW5476032.1 tail fiber protein [Enterobacter ludwigii]WLK80061.1 tail fiber protein [Enterobacter ludwigii]